MRRHHNKARRSPTERYAAAVAGSVTVLLLPTWWLLESLRLQWPRRIVFVALLVIWLVAGTLFLLARNRTKRLLRQTEFRICLHCRQVLLGLPDHGACPECGEPYELEHQKCVWRNDYRLS